MPEYSLPQALRTAAEAMAFGRGGALRQGAAALSSAYRAGEKSSGNMDFAAYLTARMPATYAAIVRVLHELKRRAPDFAPESLADVGAGPGTASWAAAALWNGLSQFTFVDNNRAFLDLATGLARHHPALASATAVLASMDTVAVKADLVIVSYALAEVAEQQAGAIARHLWTNAAVALVIIEPGTPGGFARIRRARDALIAAGANIAAPCPHAGACPMSGSDWCHFSVRLPRSRLHMQAKGATVPFEDERFSYVIATRFPVARYDARIIAPVEVNKAAARLKLCTASGVATPEIARRDAAAYKRARKCDWGDVY